MELQSRPIDRRHEIRDSTRNDPEPELNQAHLGNDFLLQQADRVTRNRVTKARMEFLGDGGAPYCTMTLEHAHRAPSTGEIEGTDQTVMPPADDDDVKIRCHESKFFRKAATW
jgi:hypothetical protein